MKKEHILILLLILQGCFGEVIAQSSFRKLSRPEKCWVLCHPIKAKRSLKITQKVQLIVDSIKQSGIIGNDNNGGNLDAFKHTFWMASLANGIGGKQALKLGRAHEKGNYLQYKKGQFEDAFLPDSVSSEMDLRNNETGVFLVENGKSLSSSSIQKKVMDALATGKLTIIKKDEQGNFLTCDNVVISMKEWKGKWGIPKCLVPLIYH